MNAGKYMIKETSKLAYTHVRMLQVSCKDVGRHGSEIIKSRINKEMSLLHVGLVSSLYVGLIVFGLYLRLESLRN